MFTCSSEGCDEPIASISQRCHFHDALSQARSLTPERFDEFRETLAKTAPITADERNRRRAASALTSIEWKARDLRRSKKEAREAGATEQQIKDAVARGKAEADAQLRRLHEFKRDIKQVDKNRGAR